MVWHKARPSVWTRSEFNAECDSKIIIKSKSKSKSKSNKCHLTALGNNADNGWMYLDQGTCKKATKVKTRNILAMPDNYSLSLRRKGQVKKSCALKMVPSNTRTQKQKPKNPVYSTNDKKTF